MSDRGIRILKFKPFPGNGVLKGFADVYIAATRLKIFDCPACASDGKRWVNLAGKPMIDRDGIALRDDRGKIRTPFPPPSTTLLSNAGFPKPQCRRSMSCAGMGQMTALGTALAFAGKGFRVLPLWWPAEKNGKFVCACGKADCRSPGKHPIAQIDPPNGPKIAPNGVRSATG
ncbi:hypothetical protein F2981_12155 [Sinorhizobium meliloti]|nr:hypothetical protein [Sinorhizobium meliloti]